MNFNCHINLILQHLDPITKLHYSRLLSINPNKCQTTIIHINLYYTRTCSSDLKGQDTIYWKAHSSDFTWQRIISSKSKNKIFDFRFLTSFSLYTLSLGYYSQIPTSNYHLQCWLPNLDGVRNHLRDKGPCTYGRFLVPMARM